MLDTSQITVVTGLPKPGARVFVCHAVLELGDTLGNVLQI